MQEPSVVAMDLEEGVPMAVGEEAKLMLGRTPGNEAERAWRNKKNICHYGLRCFATV